MANKGIRFIARSLQLMGLLVMPSAIWAGEYLHSEALAIGIFIFSLLIFFTGLVFQKYL